MPRQKGHFNVLPYFSGYGFHQVDVITGGITLLIEKGIGLIVEICHSPDGLIKKRSLLHGGLVHYEIPVEIEDRDKTHEDKQGRKQKYEKNFFYPHRGIIQGEM